MNIHESYCSLDTCKLLKQAGFDWEVNSRWQDWCTKDWFLNTDLPYYEDTNGKSNNHGFSAPTIAVAQRWLREVKGFHVSAIYAKIYDTGEDSYYRDIYEEVLELDEIEEEPSFSTYEEALEAGIKKCLTLLLKEE